MNGSESPRSFDFDVDVGTVVVIGAGIAGMRAATDLADEGHRVLLTDDGPMAKEVIGILRRPVPVSDRCGLCPDVIPEEEHSVASFYCMRGAVTSSANIEIVETAGVEATERGFRVELPGAASRTAQAVIVAGTTLTDRGAADRLARILSEVPGPTSAASSFEQARTTKRPVFACGAAAGATDVPVALLSGSAAASEASHFLFSLGYGRATDSSPRPPEGCQTRSVSVVKQALVVGATVAGMRAALSLALRGIEVQLVDQGSDLGAWPPLEPPAEPEADAFVSALRDKVQASAMITVRLHTKPVLHAGSVGRFMTVLKKRGEEEILLPHGATILATDLGPGESVQGINGHYDGAALARLFSVEAAPGGALQEASRFKPSDFLKLGLFLARPSRSLARAVTNAEAAAQRAFRFLAWPELSVERVVAHVCDDNCSQCKECLSLCPYEARKETPDGRVVLDAAVCEGCGLCAAYCQSDASELPGPMDRETLALVEATLADAHRILP
jgi:heterodisulfide reductase subunit A-like polyferredoxin